MNFPEANVTVTDAMTRAGVWAMLVERNPTESWEKHVTHIYKCMTYAARLDPPPTPKYTFDPQLMAQVPPEVVTAAATLTRWFALQGIEEWKLGACQNRVDTDAQGR